MAEKPYARYGTLHPLRQALRQAQEAPQDAASIRLRTLRQAQDVLRMQRSITEEVNV